jgi:hypothetical protein
MFALGPRYRVSTSASWEMICASPEDALRNGMPYAEKTLRRSGD